MPTYVFKGRNRMNEVVSGERVADNREACFQVPRLYDCGGLDKTFKPFTRIDATDRRDKWRVGAARQFATQRGGSVGIRQIERCRVETVEDDRHLVANAPFVEYASDGVRDHYYFVGEPVDRSDDGVADAARSGEGGSAHVIYARHSGQPRS